MNESDYKKALKSLEGEKRAALKKAKALKGQKAKDALAAVEQEFATKLQELESKRGGGVVQEVAQEEAPVNTNGATTNQDNQATSAGQGDTAEDERQRKLEKARRKKEKQRQKELEQERLEEEIAANAGPNMRHVEMEQIQTTLTPLNLTIQEVAADGHCLYRAVGAQIAQEYPQVRALCADTLAAHADDFAPFCEFTDTISNFDDYVNQVRSSAEWGGHLELRALAMALQRNILVYSTTSTNGPLEIHSQQTSDEPIILSYHHHYYALGEHYNQVVPVSETKAVEDDDH